MPEHYDRISKTLHWLVVTFVVVQFLTGPTFSTYPPDSSAHINLFRAHMLSGIVILVLMMTRLAWRLTNRWRPLPDGVPAPVRTLARTNHVLLYAALVIQPLLGIILISPLAGRLGSWPDTAHVTLAWTILALVTLHIAGALWHGFVRRDNVLQRMLPFGGNNF